MCLPDRPAPDRYDAIPVVEKHFTKTPSLTKIPRGHRYNEYPGNSIVDSVRRDLRSKVYQAYNLGPSLLYGLFWAGSQDYNAVRELDRTMLLVVELERSKMDRWREIDGTVREILRDWNLSGKHGVCVRYYRHWGMTTVRDAWPVSPPRPSNAANNHAPIRSSTLRSSTTIIRQPDRPPIGHRRPISTVSDTTSGHVNGPPISAVSDTIVGHINTPPIGTANDTTVGHSTLDSNSQSTTVLNSSAIHRHYQAIAARDPNPDYYNQFLRAHMVVRRAMGFEAPTSDNTIDYPQRIAAWNDTANDVQPWMFASPPPSPPSSNTDSGDGYVITDLNEPAEDPVGAMDARVDRLRAMAELHSDLTRMRFR